MVSSRSRATRGPSRRVAASAQPIEDPMGNLHTSLVLETVIDRTEFDLGWQMDLPGGGSVLGNDVKLLVSLELVKEA